MNIDAFSTLLGAIFGTIATIIIGFLTLKYNYNHLHAEIVSKSRNEWLNIWRDQLSKFLSVSDMLRYEQIEGDRRVELLNEYHIAKNNILLRLNMEENQHKNVYVLINRIAYEKQLSNENYFKAKELLLVATRDLLKIEWERVKKEARGRKK